MRRRTIRRVDGDGGDARVALVTGAGGGIGRAVALALSKVGYRLALIDLDAGSLAATAALLADPSAVCTSSVTMEADVTDAALVRDVCARVEADFGPVDVLVNAAGMYGERLPFVDSDPETWWEVIEINVRGPALCTRWVVPRMVQRGRGHVVNINSRAATWDDPGQSSVAYSASKAALARFTSGVAAELVGTGVVVVDLSPGMVRTQMTASRADLARLPDHAFLPATAAAAKVVALASGRYDALHGRFIHAKDDLDDLVRRLETRPGARSLTLAPTGPDDPVA